MYLLVSRSHQSAPLVKKDLTLEQIVDESGRAMLIQGQSSCLGLRYASVRSEHQKASVH